MSHLIIVIPDERGWIVRSDAFSADMAFQSGAQAETNARQIAKQFAASGEAAELQVFLRDGSLAGRYAYGASRAA